MHPSCWTDPPNRRINVLNFKEAFHVRVGSVLVDPRDNGRTAAFADLIAQADSPLPANLRRWFYFRACGSDWWNPDVTTDVPDAASPLHTCSANQIVWRGPFPLVLARASIRSTANPLVFSLRVKAASGAADHTAKMPPGFNAAFRAANPLPE